MFLNSRGKRREVVPLQLTAMIDVFSMIIIFLIKGTVFGVSSIALPPGYKLPESQSKETVENAPRIMIGRKFVHFSEKELKIPLQLFENRVGYRQQRKSYLDTVKNYVDKIPTKQKNAGVLLNVVAERDTPYQTIFDVTRAFREAGFQSLLFVAKGQ